MIILNTTFHVAEDEADAVLFWIRKSYIPAALYSGLTDPMLTRIVDSVAEGCVSFALHLHAADIDAARRWDNGPGAALRAILAKRYGERALTFSTYLEILQ